MAINRALPWVLQHLDSGQVGWPKVFSSVDLARRFRDAFLPGSSDLVLCGVGLHNSLVERFLVDGSPPAGVPPCGVYTSVQRRLALTTGGRSLGYEVLVTEGCGLSHSWLCNGLDGDAADEMGIRPNSHGFVGALQDALTVAEYCNREDVGAEPGLWLPWLIVEYDLEERAAE